MEKREFSIIRRHLGKTQAQMSQLLGISLKTIQSFEQGYRKVPGHVERQVLFLLANNRSEIRNRVPCWETVDCPRKNRKNCPAWEYQVGQFCWFINGTVCHGEVQENWEKKMEICRFCKVFLSILPPELAKNLSSNDKKSQKCRSSVPNRADDAIKT